MEFKEAVMKYCFGRLTSEEEMEVYDALLQCGTESRREIEHLYDKFYSEAKKKAQELEDKYYEQK